MKKSLYIKRPDLGCYLAGIPPDKWPADKKIRGCPPKGKRNQTLDEQQTVFFGGNAILSPPSTRLIEKDKE